MSRFEKQITFSDDKIADKIMMGHLANVINEGYDDNNNRTSSLESPNLSNTSSNSNSNSSSSSWNNSEDYI